MGSPPPEITFDSYGRGRFSSSWSFTDYVRTISACTCEEVLPTLDEVEKWSQSGGYAAGFVAYEAASALNPDLPSYPPAPGVPLLWFALYRDRQQLSPVTLPDGEPFEITLRATLDLDAYTADVERIREYIAAGHCYQVNHTFRLQGELSGSPERLFKSACEAQRARFCASIRSDAFTLLSASPELFFSLKDGIITTSPMKGTARRGRFEQEDQEIVERLRLDPKERAENLMIVDLIRNDLGIVAETGTVSVDSLFDVESYPTVHQMTSTVSARLRVGAGLSDIFRALFPCGSVTGAPKRRSMEIICEVENHPRGVYCGAIGYVAPEGEALFSVAIRSLYIGSDGKSVSMGVGSAVTWESEAAREYDECLCKGKFAAGIRGGFSLIESFCLEDSVYKLFDRHLERLSASARYFAFPYDSSAISEALLEHAQQNSGLRKVRLALAADGSWTIDSEGICLDTATLLAAVSSLRVDAADVMRYHKTTSRDIFTAARSEHPGCDEVLFLNRQGELTEGSYHNIVVKIGEGLYTPPLCSGLLPGVLRGELLARGEISEKILYPDDLLLAEELWLINSVRGWRRFELAQP